jgi:hypothetical protein
LERGERPEANKESNRVAVNRASDQIIMLMTRFNTQFKAAKLEKMNRQNKAAEL